MTIEQVEDNYEFKVAKRLLTQKYPFVLDMAPTSQEDLDKYTSYIFVNLYLDGNKLQEYFQAPLRSLVYREISEGKTFWSPYLAILFKSSDKETDKKATDTQNKMDELFHKTHYSPAIPQELKLPRRKLAVARILMTPEDNNYLSTWGGGQDVDN